MEQQRVYNVLTFMIIELQYWLELLEVILPTTRFAM